MGLRTAKNIIGVLTSFLLLTSSAGFRYSSNIGNGDIDESSPEAVEKWYENRPLLTNPKRTHLHFYVHDTVTAAKPTAVKVAPANTSAAATAFGSTYVMDDPMTVGPDPDSKIIGRAQGTFVFVNHAEDPVLSISVELVFTDGEFKGSSLSILGNNPISHAFREMPVLGGTGVFRMARGTATVNTVSVDIAKLNDVLEYHLIVEHY